MISPSSIILNADHPEIKPWLKGSRVIASHWSNYAGNLIVLSERDGEYQVLRAWVGNLGMLLEKEEDARVSVSVDMRSGDVEAVLTRLTERR